MQRKAIVLATLTVVHALAMVALPMTASAADFRCVGKLDVKRETRATEFTNGGDETYRVTDWTSTRTCAVSEKDRGEIGILRTTSGYGGRVDGDNGHHSHLSGGQSDESLTCTPQKH